MPEEAVRDQFIMVIPDEAMERICYETSDGDSGWKLKPYQYAITSNDPLKDYSDQQIFNMDGTVKPEILTLLKEYTTDQMQADIMEYGWCQLPFSGVSKAGPGTLTHHIVIPPNLLKDSAATKIIKTIYFIYADNNGNSFLFGLARANTYMIYEAGVTQSYFFNITVTNGTSVSLTDFVVNYSYATEVADHNADENAHDGVFMHLWGDETIDGNKRFTGDCSFDKTIMGTAYRAFSADIAEYYDADEKLQPGTLIEFGGKNEITKATNMVNGVVSTKPAYILNENNKMENPTLLTLNGRIPVLIKGPVNKFDLITIGEPGIGKVDNQCYNAIGRALQTNLKDEVKLVECLVQVKI